MSEEQKYEEVIGVPEGHRISHLVARLRKISGGEDHELYYEAILQPIPKPKKRVLICEFDVTGIEGGLGTAILSSRSMRAMSARIEEREV